MTNEISFPARDSGIRVSLISAFRAEPRPYRNIRLFDTETCVYADWTRAFPYTQNLYFYGELYSPVASINNANTSILSAATGFRILTRRTVKKSRRRILLERLTDSDGWSSYRRGWGSIKIPRIMADRMNQFPLAHPWCTRVGRNSTLIIGRIKADALRA